MTNPRFLMVNELSVKEAERLVANGVALGVLKGHVALFGLGALLWSLWQILAAVLGW